VLRTSTINLERWAFALKPASWPKLLVPMCLGQAIGIDATGELSWGGLAWGIAFTAFDAIFIVLMNDWGDQKVDRIKREMFPTSSRKTIPDGVLPSRLVFLAGAVAGFLAVALGLIGEIVLQRSWLFFGALAALAIFVSYTLPPLRLNYRGGGELLEAIGVGIALPWINGYAQSGAALPPALVVLPGFAVLALSSAIASGLSDERSDRRGGKRTLVTMLGNVLARRLVNALALSGAVIWLLTAWRGANGTPTLPIMAGALVALLSWNTVRRLSKAAETDAFETQRSYKSALHALIWESGLVLALGIALGPVFGF
jgi:1,4-dihydroxy-2-naphthoate octaprenyltransferase/chlorophyll synthase